MVTQSGMAAGFCKVCDSVFGRLPNNKITTDIPLAQIANDCGFTDRSYLIRSFRAEYGITPGNAAKITKTVPVEFINHALAAWFSFYE